MDSMQLQQLDNRNRDIAVAVDAVARRLEVTSSQVALAWIMARGVIPIVGATRAEQMRENMAAAELNCPKMLLPTFTLPAHLTPVIPIRCLTGICRSHWDMGVCSTTSIFRIFLHIFDERRQLYGRERSSAVIGYASFFSGLT